MSLPLSGKASTYSDYFSGRTTASGQPYSHDGFSAALLPKTNWHAVPLGTLLRLTHMGHCVVVEVNDRGAGKIDRHGLNQDPERVVDLSRAAMAALLGSSPETVTDMSAGIISIERIQVVAPGTRLGPCKP